MRAVQAHIGAVCLTHITLQPVVGDELFRAIGSGAFEVVPHILVQDAERGVIRNLGEVGDDARLVVDDEVVATQIGVDGVAVAVDDAHERTAQVVRRGVAFALVVVVAEVARRLDELLAVRTVDSVVELCTLFEDGVCRQRPVGGAILVEVVELLIRILTDFDAEGDLKAVEDVGYRGEVARNRTEQSADDALGEHDLHLGVGVDEFDESVPLRGVACRNRRFGLCARLGGGAGGELGGVDDELQEVRRIGVVVDDVPQLGAVEIEVAARDVDAAERDVGDEVARRVELEQFERDFQTGEIVGALEPCEYRVVERLVRGIHGLLSAGACRKRVLRLLHRIRERGERGQLVKAERGDVRRNGETEAYAVAERLVGGQIDCHIADVVREQRTEVVAGVTVGGELRLAGDAEFDALRAHGLEAVGGTGRKLDDVGHHCGDIGVAASLRSGEYVGFGGCEVDFEARLGFHGEGEAGVGARLDLNRKPVAAAEDEAEPGALREDEVVEDVAFAADDHGDEVAEQVAGEQHIQGKPVGKDVVVAVLVRGALVVGDAERDCGNERVEQRVDVNRGVTALICRSHRFGRTARGHLIEHREQFEQVEHHLGSADVAGVDVHLAFDEVDADVDGLADFGVEDDFDARLQRVEDFHRVESRDGGVVPDAVVRFARGDFDIFAVLELVCRGGESLCELAVDGVLVVPLLFGEVIGALREVGQHVLQIKRFEVEHAFEVDAEVVFDDVVDVEVEAEYFEQGAQHLVQNRRAGFDAGVTQQIFEDDGKDFGEGDAATDVGAVAVLDIGAFHQVVPVGLVVLGCLLLRDLDEGRVRLVADIQRQTEPCIGAVGIAVVFAAGDDRAHRVGDGFVDADGEVGVGDGDAEPDILGVNADFEGDFVTEVDIEGNLRVEREALEHGDEVLAGHCGIRIRELAHDHGENCHEHALAYLKPETAGGNLHDDCDHLFGGGVDTLGRRNGFAAARRGIVFTGHETHDRVVNHACDTRVLNHEFLAEQVDINPASVHVNAEHDIACVIHIAQLYHELDALCGSEVEVAADVGFEADLEVVVDFQTELEGEVGHERGNDVADGDDAAFEAGGFAELGFEAQRRLKGHGARAGEVGQIVVIAVRGLAFGDPRSDCLGAVVDCDAQPAEREPDIDGIDADAERDAEVEHTVTHGIEQGEVALFGVELCEFFGADGHAEQCADERRKPVCREVDFELLVGHVNSADCAEQRTDDIRRVVTCGCDAFVVGCGDCVNRLLRLFGGILFGRGKQVAEVDSGHRKAAGDEAALCRADIYRARAGGGVGYHRNREKRSALGEQVERDVGVRQQIAGVGHVFGVEAQERLDFEVDLRALRAFHGRYLEDEPLEEAPDSVAEVGVCGKNRADPLADFEVGFAALDAESDVAADFHIDAFEVDCGGIDADRCRIIAGCIGKNADFGVGVVGAESVDGCAVRREACGKVRVGNRDRAFCISCHRNLDVGVVLEVVVSRVGGERRLDGLLHYLECAERHEVVGDERGRNRLERVVVRGPAEAETDARELHEDVVAVRIDADIQEIFGLIRGEAVQTDENLREVELRKEGKLVEESGAEGVVDDIDKPVDRLEIKSGVGDVEQEFEDADFIFAAARRGDRFGRAAGFAAEQREQGVDEVEFELYARAQELVRVHINIIVFVVHRKQVVVVCDELEGELRLVCTALREVGAEERVKHMTQVELCPEGEAELNVEAFGDGDGEVFSAQGDVDVHDIEDRAQVKTEIECDKRARHEVDEFVAALFGVGYIAALAADGSVEPAEGEVEVEVVTETETDADGQTRILAGVGNLQPAGEFDFDAAGDFHTLFRAGLGDGDARRRHVDAEGLEQSVEEVSREVDIDIEVADGYLRKQHLQEAHDVEGCVVRRAVLGGIRHGNRFGRTAGERADESGEFNLEVEPAEEVVRGVEIEHAALEPQLERRGAVRRLDCYVCVDAAEERADVHGLVGSDGDCGDEARKVDDLGLELEGRVGAEGFRKLCQHGNHHAGRIGVGEACERAFGRVDVDARFKPYSDAADGGKHAVEECARVELDAREVEQEVAVFVEEDVLPVLLEQIVERDDAALGERRHGRVEVRLVDDGAELRGDADIDAEGEGVTFRVGQVECGADVDVLGESEALVGDDERCAVHGDFRTRKAAFRGEHEPEDVVEDFLGKVNPDFVDVEEVVDVRVDGLDDGNDKPDGVFDGLVLGGAVAEVTDDFAAFEQLFGLFRRAYAAVRGEDAGVDERVVRHGDELTDESAEQLVEVDAADGELARAEHTGEVDIEGLFRADVADGGKRSALAAAELNEQIGAVGIEHVDAAPYLQIELVIALPHIDGQVEQPAVLLFHGIGDDAVEQRAERAEDVVQGEAVDCAVSEPEGELEVEGEGRIFLEGRDVEPSAARGFEVTFRRLIVGEVTLDVKGRSFLLVYGTRADAEGNAVADDAVFLLEFGAVGVEVEVDAEVDAGEKTVAVFVFRGEVCGEHDVGALHCLHHLEVDAGEVIDDVGYFVADDGIGVAGSEKSDKCGTEDAREGNGHLDVHGTVLSGGEGRFAEQSADQVADLTDDAGVKREEVVENEVRKGVVAEQLAQSLVYRGEIDIVRLDRTDALPDARTVVDERRLGVVCTDKHLFQLAVRGQPPELDEELGIDVVDEVEVGDDSEGVGIAVAVTGVAELDRGVGIDIITRRGVGIQRGVDEHTPRLRPGEGRRRGAGHRGIVVGDGDCACRPAGLVTSREDACHEAENEHKQKGEFQFSHSFPPMHLRARNAHT